MHRALLLLCMFLFPIFLLPADDTGSASGQLPAAASHQVDFVKEIQPLLQARCVNCHGPEKQRSGLRLDSGALILEGGNSGPVLQKGDSAKSLLIHVIAGTDEDRIMPPKGPRLSAEEIGKFRAWIDQGAKFPSAESAAAGKTLATSHWSFQPITRPALPKPSSGLLLTNPIDAFIQAKLHEAELTPNPPADKHTLIRRLYLDLLGLPPSPAVVTAFVNDTRPDAYEKLVDRTLASPHYGERWGRHWLDAARYADSDGYEKDTGRPFAYRYRDWVIAALNADMPFDRFTIEQIAGDMLPESTMSQKMATGFHRNTLTNKEGGADPEEFRVAAVVDRVNTTATVWLGLTLNCAQCHDHKYDPLSQREYYQFFAFFDGDEEKNIPAPMPGERLHHALRLYAHDMLGSWKQVQAESYRERLRNKARVWEAGLTLAQLRKLPDIVVQSLLAEPTKRTEKQQQAILDFHAKSDKRAAALVKALADHKKTMPRLTQAQTLEAGPGRKTHIHLRGDFLRKGVAVQAGVPGVLPSFAEEVSKPKSRLDLAKWLVDARQPLTPRVIVNWVWMKHFGRGLVNTPNDFGVQGEKPSHPELLDWLASEFMQQGWSLKRLHRLIVTSHAYRQSSATTTEQLQRDPLNVFLSRHPRLRLEAEIVRDNALAVSGLLVADIGGPSVRPPQPSGIAELSYANSVKWREDSGKNRYRRGMYTWFQRTSPYPMLMTFDSPESTMCSVQRERSNTPLQALTLLNDVVFVEAAQALTRRLFAQHAVDERARMNSLYQLCLARLPAESELKVLDELLQDYRTQFTDTAEAKRTLGSYLPSGVAPREAAAWMALCRTILNLDEFITRE